MIVGDCYLLEVLGLANMTGSGWITINGAHVKAEPGQPINYAGLRATKGGEAKKSLTIDQSKISVDDEYNKYKMYAALTKKPSMSRDDYRQWIMTKHLGSKMDPETIAGLIGIKDADGYKIKLTSDGVDITIEHRDYRMQRRLYMDSDGKKVVYNNSFEVKNTGMGTGTNVLADQIKSLRSNGYSRMEAYAAKEWNGKSFNGYYTWARLGYNGPLSPTIKEILPKSLRDAKDVASLMKTKEGRDWWKANGEGMEMSFDLSKSSTSSKVFDAYMKEKSSGKKA